MIRENNMQDQMAVFDVFLRTKNENDYAIVYGIYDVLELIEILNETSYEDRKKYLSELSDNENFIEYMSNMKFTGSIRGVRDGEMVLSNEPILTVTAPLIQGKIMETPILNVLNYQILTATVTSKIIQASEDREVLFFGTRRASGFEAAMSMVKACSVTGCASHSNLMGEYFYNLKSTGTMTHGFIQSFGMDKDSEYRAFNQFIKTYRNKKYPLIMLVDTYDTIESGIISAIRAFRDNGIDDGYEGMYGIRIDSGNLGELSKKCRKILNEKGFYRAKIILTGGLDEKKIKELIENGAEVDIFGVGDAIALPEKEISTVYKMSKIGENDVMKISNEEQKTSLPGSKILYRVYENDDFIVINKSYGMVIHPAYGNYSGTLVNALLYYTNNLSSVNGNIRPGIIHRLDKDTSGLILVAKNNYAHAKLASMFIDKTIHKTYLCIVKGNFSEGNLSGRIENLIGRDTKDRKKMTVVKENGKIAISNYKVIEQVEGYSLVEVAIETGRTHQIRVHMKSINHVILGDAVYGTEDKNVKRQMLHAYKLEFLNPLDNKEYVFKGKLFNDFIEVAKKLKFNIEKYLNK